MYFPPKTVQNKTIRTSPETYFSFQNTPWRTSPHLMRRWLSYLKKITVSYYTTTYITRRDTNYLWWWILFIVANYFFQDQMSVWVPRRQGRSFCRLQQILHPVTWCQVLWLLVNLHYQMLPVKAHDLDDRR